MSAQTPTAQQRSYDRPFSELRSSLRKKVAEAIPPACMRDAKNGEASESGDVYCFELVEGVRDRRYVTLRVEGDEERTRVEMQVEALEPHGWLRTAGVMAATVPLTALAAIGGPVDGMSDLTKSVAQRVWALVDEAASGA